MFMLTHGFGRCASNLRLGFYFSLPGGPLVEEGEKHFDSISAEWVVPVDGELERQVVWEKGGGGE